MKYLDSVKAKNLNWYIFNEIFLSLVENLQVFR